MALLVAALLLGFSATEARADDVIIEPCPPVCSTEPEPGQKGRDTAEQSIVSQMMEMNLQFLALQNAVDAESRKYQALVNASKRRNEAAANAISNMRG